MQVEHGKTSIRTTILWKSSLVVSASLVFLFHVLGEAAPLGEAGPQVATPPLQMTMRSFSEFLAAQGPTGPKFFPPVKNYVGWVGADRTTFALIDYLGFADDYLRGQLRTQVAGTVTQTDLPDGRARIDVNISTTNALGFAQSVADLINSSPSGMLKFKNTPTIFGNKARDVRQGAEAAVGPVSFFVTFTIASPDAPLPDLVDVLVNDPEAFSPIEFNFQSTIPGACENGTRAVLHVVQIGPLVAPIISVVEILTEPCT